MTEYINTHQSISSDCKSEWVCVWCLTLSPSGTYEWVGMSKILTGAVSTCECLHCTCVSFQLEQMLTLQSGESDQESVYGAEQQRLREESRAYRLKLQAYQDSQQKQAQLVHKLQAKVYQATLIFILTFSANASSLHIKLFGTEFCIPLCLLSLCGCYTAGAPV